VAEVKRGNAKDQIGILINLIHRSVFTATRGRVLGKIIGMPALVLTTTGRKTGKKRQNMLTSPTQVNGNPVIVASWGGDDRYPLWFRNLQANPDVEITMAGKTEPKRARVLEGAEYDEVWARVTKDFKNYADYQTKTSRKIPLIVLEPR
jgi:deazaflavin-dependent oxidoreductase (nitroreductase family)